MTNKIHCILWFVTAAVLVACKGDPSRDSADAGADASNPGAGEIDSAGGTDAERSTGTACETGAAGCPCYGNGTCKDALPCVDGVCSPPETCDDEDGTPGCPCYGNGTCDDGLICREGVCRGEGCGAGPGTAAGCPCREDGDCGRDLYCTDDLCAPCAEAEAFEVGCPCDEEDRCGDDLICDTSDAEDARCREARTCEELLCGEMQVCVEGTPAVDAHCDCTPGMAWDDLGTGCVADASCNCAEGMAGSILETCYDQNRSCDDGLECGCGGCLNGFKESGTSCIPVVTCAYLTCAAQNRLCTPESAHEDAACAGCAPGHVEENGLCLPGHDTNCDPAGGEGSIFDECLSLNRLCEEDAAQGDVPASCGECLEGYQENPATNQCETTRCEDLACGIVNRRCEETPRAVCTICMDGFVEDGESGECREIRTCDDLDCPDAGDCAPHTETADAYCYGCAGDALLDRDTGECVSCPPCDNEGELGHETELTANNNCICITEPGYFYNEGLATHTQPCDQDQDGWVRRDADVPWLSGDEVLIRNARCRFRTIDRFVFRSDSGGGAHHEWTVPLEPPLYMFEAPALDDDDSIAKDPESYMLPGDRLLRANELNSLTKVCLNVNGDFNGNQLADVDESQIDVIPDPDSAQLFVKYGYFIELHRSWFEANPDAIDPDNVTGAYIIEEKWRDASAPQGKGIPLEYPAGEGEYWRECTRWRDADAEDAALLKTGMDFTSQFSCEGGEYYDCADPVDDGVAAYPDKIGMMAHSQFKCIRVASPTTASEPENEAKPNYLTKTEINDSGLYLNACQATAASNPPVGDDLNPSDPELDCSTITPDDVEEGDVRWAVVGYQDTEDMLTKEGNALHGVGYKRGCINECRMPTDSLGEESCNVDDGSKSMCDCPNFHGARTACDGDVNDYGKLVCGCHTNYGTDHGQACALGCPDGQLMTTPDLDPSTRDGYWMCGKLAGSSGERLGNGESGYSIVGGVSVSPVDRRKMTDGVYTVVGNEVNNQ